MIKAVDEMLETMTTKFHKISSEVFAKSETGSFMASGRTTRAVLI